MTDIDQSDLRQRMLQLTISPDGEEFVLGRADLGNYVAVPEPGAVFVKVLQDGGSLADAAARASAVAGEPVDGADFLDGLAQAGLLEPTGRPGEVGRARRGKEIGWVEGVSPSFARALFGVPAWTFYTSCFILAILLLYWRPDLRPTWESSWYLPDPALCVLTLVPISLLIGACHEAWHWLAGRAVGVPAVFRVSYRGVLVVFETDLTQIVTLPRRRRYSAFLAGMALDSVWLAAALVLRMLYTAGIITMARRNRRRADRCARAICAHPIGRAHRRSGGFPSRRPGSAMPTRASGAADGEPAHRRGRGLRCGLQL